MQTVFLAMQEDLNSDKTEFGEQHVWKIWTIMLPKWFADNLNTMMENYIEMENLIMVVKDSKELIHVVF